MAAPPPEQPFIDADSAMESEMEEEGNETQSELEEQFPLFPTNTSIYPGDQSFSNNFGIYDEYGGEGVEYPEYGGEGDLAEEVEGEDNAEEDFYDDDDDDEGEEGEYSDDPTDDWELPPMSHQLVPHTTSAGFGEIFHTRTKPIYSKMNLNQLVSAVNFEMPPIEKEPSLTVAEKHEQFERTYGKLKEVEKGSGHDRAGSLSNPTPPPANLIDVMQSNFSKTIVKTYLYRMVLIGEHREDQEKFIEWMKDAVEDINMHCYSETLTGVFLMYPYHFVHVIEGSEDTLMKYVRFIADQFEPTGYDWKLEVTKGSGSVPLQVSVRPPIIFTTVKAMIVGIFQIRQRGIANGWKVERAGSGLTMTADQVPQGDFRERLFQFTRMTMIMAIALYKLTPLRPPPGMTYLPSDPIPPPPKRKKKRAEADNGLDNPSSVAVKGAVSSSAAADIEARERFDDQRRRRAASIAQLVPKPAMIDYIMRKNDKRKIQLRTVREHLDYFWKIPKVVLDQQTDWPIPGRIAPYD